jgi:pimeloyl-ACP methyl ester carboxylesterase
MGRDDPLVPLINGRIVARLIPNAQLEIIDDGHLFMVTQPQERAKRIEKFLSDPKMNDALPSGSVKSLNPRNGKR